MSDGAAGAANSGGAENPGGSGGRVTRSALRQRTRRAIRAAAGPLLAARRWLLWPHAVRGWWATLARELVPADVYHACGALAIQPALEQRRRRSTVATGRPVRVIYDAIDDIAGSNETTMMPAAIRRRIARRERDWARAADAVVTVNQALAARLAVRYGRIDDILVVPNYPEPQAPVEAIDDGLPGGPLREAAGVGPDRRIVLFQGRLGPGLGLDAAAEAVLEVPNAALVLMGFGRGMPASLARDRDARFVGSHVTLPAVDPDDLTAWTAGADVMLIPLPPISPNQRDATPNKFWEALAVGVPVVVVGGLTAMEDIVEAHDLGAIAASPSATDLAAAIRAVLARLDVDAPAWRARIAATSRSAFSWPETATRYRRLVRSVLGETVRPLEPSSDSSPPSD